VEILALIFHALEGLLGFIDILSIFVDIYSWIKGTENRQERKAAKQQGLPTPKRDKWFWYVLVSSSTFVITSLLLLYKYVIP
jgi:hypothetical protein